MKMFIDSVLVSSSLVSSAVERLGWSLMHSVWQLAAIAVLAAIVNRVLRNQTARARYIASVSMLVLMVFAPCVSWFFVSSENGPSVLTETVVFPVNSDDRENSDDRQSKVAAEVLVAVSDKTGHVEIPSDVAVQIPGATESASDAVAANNAVTNVATNQSASSPNKQPDFSGKLDSTPAGFTFAGLADSAATILRPRLSMLVGLWIVGVVFCSIRPIWSLYAQWRLRRSGLSKVEDSVKKAMLSLAHKMGLRRAVRIAESALVKVPMVVGYLRPMILLPASVLTGLTPSQLEAVLAHELAHVQRHDWLINAMQVLAETLLFYHPAIWWISRRIRHERELCCDDMVLGLKIDKAVYARMLLTLEELHHKAVSPALAATGGDLAARVRRLLPPATRQEQARSSAAGFAIIVASLALVLVATFMTTSVLSEPQSVDAKHPVTLGSPAAAADNAKTEIDAAFVTGQVIHTNGKPAAGVEVNFGTNRLSLLEKAMLTGLTDANGRYRFTIAQRHLAARARVYVIPINAAAVSRAVSKNFGEQPVFQLQPGTRLSGKVIDAEGKGVAKVVVKIDGGERIPMRYAISNDNGEYTSPPCQYGDYKIKLLDAGTIPSSDERGVSLAAAYLLKEHSISKSARTHERLADFRPVDSAKIQVHLQSSNGNPISDDTLFLFGTTSEGSWSERLHEVSDRPGLHEIIVPKGLYGGFQRMHPGGWPKHDYVLSMANGNLGHFVSDESLVFTMKKVCWLELTIAVDGELIEQRTNVHDISDRNLFDDHRSGIFYSLKAAGDPLVQRFANAHVIGPMSRGHASIHMTLAPDTEYELHVETMSGKSCKETFTTKEGESRSIEANLVSDAQAANSATEAVEPVRLSEALTDDKTLADDETDDPAKIEIRKRTVKVVDENEQPVARAAVRFQFQHSEPDTFSIDGLMTETTDAKGIATVEAPPESEQLHLTIKADGFGEFSEQQQATGNSVVRLERGRVIQVRALDEAGTVLKEAVPLLTQHRIWGREFVPQDDGTFKSPAVDMNRHLMRVATSQDNGLMLFSDLVDVSTAKPGKDGVLELVLKQGTKLVGRLDDSVGAKGIHVQVVPGGDSKFALVGALVHPVDGRRANVTERSELPECVFVFDMQGKLGATLGGAIGTTGAGDPENISSLSLGPRYGSLYFDFPGSRGNRADDTVGITNGGVSVNGIITWDADKDMIHKATIPLPLGDPPAVHPPIVNVLNPGESTQLVSRSLKGSTDSLTLQVKLQSVEK